MKRIYLDYNATTPVCEEAQTRLTDCLRNDFGNPSSIHQVGQRARYVIEKAREKIASALKVAPQDVIFTSGGTESNNLVLKGVLSKMKDQGKNHLVITTAEHPSVQDTARLLEEDDRIEVTRVGVDASGIIDLDALRLALGPRTGLVSVLHANNETGRVQPMDAVASIVREGQSLLHVDCCQSFGKLEFDAAAIGADFISMSSHKIYGPKGSGALYIGRQREIRSLFQGGFQEKNIRPGTENVPAIAGFGAAIEFSLKNQRADQAKWMRYKTRLWDAFGSSIGGVHLNGSLDASLPNTLNVSIEALENTALVMALDLEGIAVSTGSACTSGVAQPSHVLMAMGLGPARSGSAIRISMGHSTTEEEIEHFICVLSRVVDRLRLKKKIPMTRP